MTKILYLVTQSEFGGAQRYIFNLALNLAKKNYQITVAAGGNQALFSKLSEAGISCIKLKHLAREINLLKDWLAYREIKKMIKDIKPDILHLNSSKAGVIGALAGRRCHVKKIIYTVHGFVFNEPMSKLKKRFYLWAEKYSAKYKDILICVSEFDRQVGIQNNIAPKNKFITINNGISKINFLDKEIAKETLGLPANKKIIGSISYLYPTKGFNYFIKAAKIILAAAPDTLFAIIGEGQERKKIEAEIADLNLQDNFFILGEKIDAAKYLKAFDIYVCSSVKEGFPFSILEAMQAELPIVATNVGGIPEIITNEKNGLLVLAEDQISLAKTVIKLIEDGALAQKISRQAKIDAEQKFSSERMLALTESIYKD